MDRYRWTLVTLLVLAIVSILVLASMIPVVIITLSYTPTEVQQCSGTMVEIAEEELCTHNQHTPDNSEQLKNHSSSANQCIVIPDTYIKPQPADTNNVVSMSAWGSDKRYVNGVIANAKLIATHFPGWTLRVYTPAEDRNCSVNSATTFHVEPMPEEYHRELRSLKTDIIYVNNTWCDIPPMMWRFLVADDMSVHHFIARDADSRLSARDSAVVQAWLESGATLHCARDHPSHANYPLSGGLWGGIPHRLRNIFNSSIATLMRTHSYTSDYLQDMLFLRDHVWPRFADGGAYCSDSVSCHTYPASYPFPVRRVGYEHLGQVYDGNGVPRAGDIDIMCNSAVVPQCVPQPLHRS